VIEDDYDSEFRYHGRPLAALQAIDQYRRVVYVGTFSKLMFPGLRLGYLIAPLELVDAFRAAHLSVDVHAHLLEQAVTSDFMNTRNFEQHLRRMRVLYSERQKVLFQEAARAGSGLRLEGSNGGLHLVGWISERLCDRRVAQDAAKAGVHVWPLSLHCFEARLPPALLLGYAGTKAADLRDGMATLASILMEASTG
jgi:GntR family transcriptional regulator/MocR family aminotransferase